MKKAILIFLSVIVLNNKLYSQAQIIGYRQCVKEFYNILLSHNPISIGTLSKVYANGGIHKEAEQMVADSFKKSVDDYNLIASKSHRLNNKSQSFLIKEIRSFNSELTQGLSLKELYSLIAKADIVDQGDELINYLKITFPNNKSVYFALNTDSPTQIIWVYLPDGQLLEGHFYNYAPGKLWLIGKARIHQRINVLTDTVSKSKSAVNILSSAYFFYVPDSNSKWWLIKLGYSTVPIGYIRKDMIIKYSSFSTSLKNKVIKELYSSE